MGWNQGSATALLDDVIDLLMVSIDLDEVRFS